MEKISVIIPAYNAEATLGETIRAVLGQSHTDLELIVVDDGSRDGTAAACGGFADPRVRVFRQENAGVSAARNLGLNRATGEYITFLDADDIVPPDYLAMLYNACQSADIAVCDVVSIQDGRETVRFTCPSGILMQAQALNLLLERRGINSGPCAKLFRREILKGMAFPPMKAYEDILFVREAFCRAERIAVTDRTEYRYIQNPGGAMSRFFRAPSTDIVRATEALLTFLKTRRDLSTRCFYITASHLMQYVQGTEDQEFLRAARECYRRFLPEIFRCSAFPGKEKIVFALFVCGFLYADGTMKWIGGWPWRKS